ncbi:MAG: hypothetical protein OXU23_09055 [Candidatus Poribacteria bacterium]|nr:hypothetical protein [Candidatus Poribacteria bacterium]
MKFALGIFIGIFISCVLFIVLAPDSVHEVIDRIHGNSDSNDETSTVPEDNSEGGVVTSDEKPEPPVVPEGNSEEDMGPSDEKSEPVEGKKIIWVKSLPSDEKSEPVKKKRYYKSSAPIEPRTKDEMIDWLSVHNYRVEEGQGFYRIYWKNLKPVSSRPTIVVRRDGTVVPQYGGHSVASEGSIVSVGNNNTSTVTNNGITTTASTKYENGSWCIETIRSFDWVPSQENINDVLSKAKKIKEMNNEN